MNTLRTMLCICLCLVTLCLKAQFYETFEDFLWEGDTANFVITPDHQLRLDAKGAGKSFVYTALPTIDSFYWEGLFKLDFSPSNSNKLKIFLALDTPDVSTANGYFLELGESGANDHFEFHRLSNGQPQKMGEAMDAILGLAPAECRFKVIKENAKWEIYGSYDLDREYVFLFEVIDTNQTLIPNYFALECNYTSTRTDKFYFDDFYIGRPYADIYPPEILDIVVTANNKLSLIFNESVSPSSLINENIELMPDHIHPVNIAFSTLGNNILNVDFSRPFKNGVIYFLVAKNIFDLHHNYLDSVSISFTYLEPDLANKGDIIITEIMADPLPSIGLPESE